MILTFTFLSLTNKFYVVCIYYLFSNFELVVVVVLVGGDKVNTKKSPCGHRKGFLFFTVFLCFPKPSFLLWNNTETRKDFVLPFCTPVTYRRYFLTCHRCVTVRSPKSPSWPRSSYGFGTKRELGQTTMRTNTKRAKWKWQLFKELFEKGIGKREIRIAISTEPRPEFS